MSLFSFFRRKKAAQGDNRAVGRNVSPDIEKQGKRGHGVVDEVDPQLPEKQRARRRLIGSIVLVVVALIVLPLVFESKPQKPNLSLAVQVDSHTPSPVPLPEAQSVKAEQGIQPATDQPAKPLPNQSVTSQNMNATVSGQTVNNTMPVLVSEPVKEAEADRSMGNAKTDKVGREWVEKERGAKTRTAHKKNDEERVEKERKVLVERRDATRRKASSSDLIGQIIANKTKRH